MTDEEQQAYNKEAIARCEKLGDELLQEQRDAHIREMAIIQFANDLKLAMVEQELAEKEAVQLRQMIGAVAYLEGFDAQAVYDMLQRSARFEGTDVVIKTSEGDIPLHKVLWQMKCDVSTYSNLRREE